jgi:peroxiredoxin
MKARKIIAIAVVGIVMMSLFFMISKMIKKTKSQKKIEQQTASLPDFSFQSTSGHPYTTDSLPSNKYCLIIHFLPGCDYCQYEAREIKKNIHKFTISEVLMVSSSDSIAVSEFAIKYGLNEYHNIHFLLDNAGLFHKKFGTSSVPAIFIYDRHHKLIKKIIGEVKTEVITNSFVEK